MKIELKPCPFCRGQAIIFDRMSDSRAYKWYQVFCTGCGNRTSWYKSIKTVANKWNKRCADED